MAVSTDYVNVVWSRYKKNRIAYVALWILVVFFLAAIWAPALCSNHPFVVRDADATLFPWIRALFHAPEPIDLVFNMALLMFLPAMGLWGWMHWHWRRRRVAAYKQLLRWLAMYAALTAALSLVCILGDVRPSDRYRGRDFGEEELAASSTVRSWYPPIPFGPTQEDIDSRFMPPMYRKPVSGWTRPSDRYPHLFGTDDTGRDVLVEMLYGMRISLTVGFIAVSVYLTIGCVVGAIAGYFGGAVDAIISRLIEIVLLFPSFFLILILVAVMGPSIYMIMLVIGVTGWPTIARLVRAEVLKQRSLDYVAAARSLGAGNRRILLRHVLPNSLSPAMVAAPFGIAGAIITEAALSLLGLGVRPPTPSWGAVLQLGSSNYSHWWLVAVPSLAILATVTIFNVAGNAVRDAMDPRVQHTVR
jgi:peptide/nickel transport system permease protein